MIVLGVFGGYPVSHPGRVSGYDTSLLMRLSSFYWAPGQDLQWPYSCQVRDSGDFLQKSSGLLSSKVPSPVTVPTEVCSQQICWGRGGGAGGSGLWALEFLPCSSSSPQAPKSVCLTLSRCSWARWGRCLCLSVSKYVSIALFLLVSPSLAQAPTLPLPIRFPSRNPCWGPCPPLSQQQTRI